MKKNVIKKWAVVVVTGIFMTSLTGCGTKTGATEQVPESSNEVVEVSNENIETEVTETEIEIEDDAEVSDEFVGAEDENIVLYAEVGSQDYCPFLKFFKPVLKYKSWTGEVQLLYFS